VTLAATALPQLGKGEVIRLKQLLDSNTIVVGLLVMVITTMIVATVCSTTRLLNDELSRGHFVFSSTSGCPNGLEYCSWPPGRLAFSSPEVVAP
jgi:hypothetical protein